MPDAAELLRRYRPDPPPESFEPGSGRGRATFEAITTSHAPQRGPRRRRRRRSVALVAALALGALLTAGLASSLVRGPEVLDEVAHAADAFAQPGGIYHFKVRRSNAQGLLEEHEVWHTADGRSKRILFPGGLETVRDYASRFQGSYNPQMHAILRQVDPGQWQHPPADLESPVMMSTENISGLARTLERARSNQSEVKLVGESTVRGIPVYELRFEFEAAHSDFERTIFVDRERYLPVRVVEGDIVDDFSEIERLPRTADTERLLKMSPHPGARTIVESDL